MKLQIFIEGHKRQINGTHVFSIGYMSIYPILYEHYAILIKILAEFPLLLDKILKFIWKNRYLKIYEVFFKKNESNEGIYSKRMCLPDTNI